MIIKSFQNGQKCKLHNDRNQVVHISKVAYSKQT